jgi:hypothetical protein
LYPTKILAKIHNEAFNTAFVTGAIQASHTHMLRNIAGIGSAPLIDPKFYSMCSV